jgi:hypothetical protein
LPQPLAQRTAKLRVGAGISIGVHLFAGGVGLDALALVELADEREPPREAAMAGGFADRALHRRRVFLEELEVLTKIEDIKERLVLSGRVEIRAQARAAADHLPELRRRPDGLEEHEVHHLGHVDPGVEHVHRDGQMRHLVLLAEVPEQGLDALGLRGDHAGELALVVGIVNVEAQENLLESKGHCVPLTGRSQKGHHTTGVGVRLCSVVPSPSSPYSFLPQHWTAPSMRRAHVW